MTIKVKGKQEKSTYDNDLHLVRLLDVPDVLETTAI